MPTLIPIEELLYDTLRQGRLFAETSEATNMEIAGSLRRLWPATKERLKVGDCLRNEDTEVLLLLGNAIVKAREDRKDQLETAEPHEREGLFTRKVELDILMMSYLAFTERRQQVLDRKQAEVLYQKLF
jgi:hypothetical protein